MVHAENNSHYLDNICYPPRHSRKVDIYYEPLAEGVRHFKETEKGREAMCESFERLANKYADQVGDAREEQTKVDMVKALMKNMKFSLEQALTALGIKGKERAIIAKRLQNS